MTNLVRDWQKITSIELQFQKPGSPAQPDILRMPQAQLDQYAARRRASVYGRSKHQASVTHSAGMDC